MRVLNNKGNVVEVSEQNGGITYFSYLKKNRLYYYQIRETQTSAYPWEEDFTVMMKNNSAALSEFVK